MEMKMITQRVAAVPETIARMRPMKKLTLAALLAAVAIAVTVPLTRAQSGGYGPGMMGGQGGYGMGPGMMGSYGGYGMGPGMMGSYGGYGMGPGMMYGDGGDFAGALDLSKDQREKIAKIQESFSAKQWGLMGQMREQQFKLRELLASGKADDAAVGKAYRQVEDLRQQMWTSGAEARKETDAVLTKAQRDQLGRGWDRDGAGN
jgi:Spy/CpxP family protein refolding chaperone